MNDAILKSALKDALLQEVSLLPSEEELSKPYSISSKCDRKIKRIMRSAQKPVVKIMHFTVRRSLVAAVAIMLLLTGCMAIPPIREQVVKFFMEITPIYSELKFDKPSSEYADIEFTHDLPTPPKGYEVTEEIKSVISYDVQFANKAGEIIYYSKVEAENSTMLLDTEGITTTDIYINGCKGFKYTNKGTNNIIWTDEKYVYCIDSTCSMAQLEEMALSIE